MNLYIRYFDEERLVSNVEDAFDFISSIPGVTLDDYFKNDLRSYLESGLPYPKRYKVRPRVYFIVIKTLANTLEEFKLNGGRSTPIDSEAPKDFSVNRLNDENVGWYDGRIIFKRVTCIPGTNKFQYIDTPFAARLKAKSPIDCYNRIIDHLHSRQDVDPRSQFPSAKGKNFMCNYIGMELPEESN